MQAVQDMENHAEQIAFALSLEISSSRLHQIYVLHVCVCYAHSANTCCTELWRVFLFSYVSYQDGEEADDGMEEADEADEGEDEDSQ